MVQGIENSHEFQQDAVAYLYLRILHRLPDPGAQGWVNLLAAGGTIVQVTQGLTSSAEYFALHGGNNESFVTALYLDILNLRAG